MLKIVDVVVRDIRFPTSVALDGSDAMNPDPAYSAAYVTLKTNSSHCGNGLTFTIGRGNELCVAAVHAMKYMLINRLSAQGLNLLVSVAKPSGGGGISRIALQKHFRFTFLTC